MKRRAIFFLSIFLAVFFCALTRPIEAVEFYGDRPTGLLELEKKYPYYLFVPPDYTHEKGWPLVVLLGGTAEEPKEVLKQWLDWAKKNQVLLLVGTVFPREGTIPESVDQWWLQIKQEVAERYHVGLAQTLLVGVENGAAYAAYLGIRYPEEFSAAALFRRAWPGPFDRLMRPSRNPRKHIAFYVAVDPAAETYSATETRAAELESKGYPMVLDPLKADEDFSAHRDRMIQWFISGTETRALKAQRKFKRGVKGTLQRMRKNMFGK